MAEQLQAQERALSRKLEERLADVGKRVGDSLEKSSQTAQRPTVTAGLRWQPKMRSEEHTSELQSLMRISYAVFCLKKKKSNTTVHTTAHTHPHCTHRRANFHH